MLVIGEIVGWEPVGGFCFGVWNCASVVWEMDALVEAGKILWVDAWDCPSNVPSGLGSGMECQVQSYGKGCGVV